MLGCRVNVWSRAMLYVVLAVPPIQKFVISSIPYWVVPVLLVVPPFIVADMLSFWFWYLLYMPKKPPLVSMLRLWLVVVPSRYPV